MIKVLTSTIVAFIFLAAASTVFAGAKNSEVYTEWGWQGEKSGYFQTTGSGIVHLWSYDRPNDEPDIHFVIKPLKRFPHAECDEEAIKESATWKPINLYNVQNTDGYKAAFNTIFPELNDTYYLCGYAIE
jgi:hypothetical protein